MLRALSLSVRAALDSVAKFGSSCARKGRLADRRAAPTAVCTTNAVCLPPPRPPAHWHTEFRPLTHIASRTPPRLIDSATGAQLVRQRMRTQRAATHLRHADAQPHSDRRNARAAMPGGCAGVRSNGVHQHGTMSAQRYACAQRQAAAAHSLCAVRSASLRFCCAAVCV